MKKLNHPYDDPRYSVLESRLRDLGEQLVEAKLTKYNPTNNSGDSYQGKIFSIRAYFWGDCDCPLHQCNHQPPKNEECDRDCPTADHRDDCPEEAPNFQSGDLKVWWYKYIGREMDFTDVPANQIRSIIRTCEDEISNMHGPHKHCQHSPEDHEQTGWSAI